SRLTRGPATVDDLPDHVADVEGRVAADLQLVPEQLLVQRVRRPLRVTSRPALEVLAQDLAGARGHGARGRVDDQELLLDTDGAGLPGRAVPSGPPLTRRPVLTRRPAPMPRAGPPG